MRAYLREKDLSREEVYDRMAWRRMLSYTLTPYKSGAKMKSLEPDTLSDANKKVAGAMPHWLPPLRLAGGSTPLAGGRLPRCSSGF